MSAKRILRLSEPTVLESMRSWTSRICVMEFSAPELERANAARSSMAAGRSSGPPRWNMNSATVTVPRLEQSNRADTPLPTIRLNSLASWTSILQLLWECWCDAPLIPVMTRGVGAICDNGGRLGGRIWAGRVARTPGVRYFRK